MAGGAFSYLNGQRVKSYLKRTDGVFWQILDFKFLEGDPYTERDVADGRMVAVINESTRAAFFGGAARARAARIEVDGQRFTVVGVVPDVPILRVVPFADIWVPYTTEKSDSYTRELVGNYIGHSSAAGSRPKLALTRDEFWSRLRTVKPSDRMFKTVEATPETLFDTLGRMFVGGGSGAGTGYGRRSRSSSPSRRALFMLLPAVNLMNLNTSRILERASEIGVRKAFGASSRMLVGQFVVENVVLTLVGAALGFVVAALAAEAINASGLIQYAQLQLNYRIFAWGVGLARLLRPALGRLSGVAHVAAAPRPGTEGSLAMIRHLFKLIWNRKRTNVLMMTEIFVSFLVLFAVVALGVYMLDNWRRPIGFSIDARVEHRRST